MQLKIFKNLLTHLSHLLLFNKISLFYYTLRHLKAIQIRYQVWYRIRRFWRNLTRFQYPLTIPAESISLQLIPWIEKPITFFTPHFTFLNQTKKYGFKETEPAKINWNEPNYDKLWAYNLNYMDYLLQPGMDITTATQLISHYIHDLPYNKTGLDSYPIALRGINWIKFFSANKIKRTDYDNSLYAQYCILNDTLEYHLLGNHLLENGFSLLFGAYYFNDQKLFKKANKIITNELNEQILKDGGHFELSPMYHQIILDRLLDCVNMTQNNNCFRAQKVLLFLMQDKARQMIRWINTMTFSNGLIPLLNDSASGIAPMTIKLNEYAVRLALFNIDQISLIQSKSCQTCLNASGYRMFNNSNYECIIDVGQVGPAYQPGHAHADTFSFVLYLNNEPLIVDPGISTYENNATRLMERSTSMHNTVTVKNHNSSQVWSSFRVAQRAEVTILQEKANCIFAKHNGYRNLGTTHFRNWKFSENSIEINDRLKGKIDKGVAHFILQQEIKPDKNGHNIQTKSGNLIFENVQNIRLIQIQLPTGYNKFSDSWKIEIDFIGWLITTIKWEDQVISPIQII